MDDFALARSLHLLAIILWVGGVGFVTTTATPTIRALYAPAERLAAFHAFERRFVWQARMFVLLAGASGLWMVWRGALWESFADPHFWWMHAMVALWALFMAMLFVIEPSCCIGALFNRRRRTKTRSLELMHRVLLTALLATRGTPELGARA